MPQHSYLDFDLLVESDGQGGYRSRVLKSPVGETPACPVAIPFSDLEVENFLLKVGRPRRQAARGVGSPEVAAVRDFGARLFDAVFKDRVRGALASSLDQVELLEDTGLRVRLRLSDCPELAELPWEYLYDSDIRRFLALSEWTPVIRYLELPGRIRPLAVRPPLRILVMAASPTDFEPLDVQAEWDKVREALDGLQQAGRVQLDRVPSGTLGDLRRQLRRGEYHVFHFIGHGRYDPGLQDGVLAMEGPGGRAQLVTGADLGALLHDHRSLRLALLNSCEGARGGLGDPYSGTAQSLCYQGIPAVVAMQFEITDQAAIAFGHSLYEAVADGYPLDAAMAEARNAVRDRVNPVEWATPVLYLRAADGRVFDIWSAQPAPGRPPDEATPGGTEADPDQRDSSTAGEESQGRPEVGRRDLGPATPEWLTHASRQARDRLAEVTSRLREGVSGPRGGTPPPVATPDAAVLPARRIRAYPEAGSCVHAAVGPNDLVAVAGTDGVIRVLSARTGRFVARCSLPHGERPKRVAWGPWPRHVASIHDQGLVVVWDLERELPVRIMRAAKRRVDAVAFSHDGRWLMTAGERELRVFDDRGAQVRALSLPPVKAQPVGGRATGTVNAVAFTPGDRHALVAGDDGMVRQLDSGGRQVQVWEHPASILALAVHAGGLVTGSAAGKVGSWTWDRRLLWRSDHDGSIEHVAVSADGGLVATVAADCTVRLWARAGTAAAESPLSRRSVGVAFLADGTGLLTVNQLGALAVWEPATGEARG